MIELKLPRVLMLIKQMLQQSVLFATTGIFSIKKVEVSTGCLQWVSPCINDAYKP